MNGERDVPKSGEKRPRPSKVNEAVHQRPRPVKKSSALCVDFNAGHCAAGLECSFRHDLSAEYSE
jgi:16S rRNA G966 N2-methylase RsmD